MDVQCLRVKLKPGTTDEFIAYAEGLKSKMDQVRRALLNETMVVESIFLDRCEDGDYIIFYTRAESLQKANEYLSSSTDPVDLEAQAIIQRTWDLTVAKALPVLFDVDRIAAIEE